MLHGDLRGFTMNSYGRTALPTEERLCAGSLYAALNAFRGTRADMPLQYVITFLLVAMEEGKSVGEYARRCGVAKSVLSRHILDLSVRARSGGPGLDLLMTRTNPTDARSHEVFLTPKGRTVAHQVLQAWKMSGAA